LKNRYRQFIKKKKKNAPQPSNQEKKKRCGTHCGPSMASVTNTVVVNDLKDPGLTWPSSQLWESVIYPTCTSVPAALFT